MNIITKLEWPAASPQPFWTAIDDSTYDIDAPFMGTGATEQEAIDDLLWQLEEWLDTGKNCQ